MRRRGCIASLLTLIITLLLIDFGLSLFDPLGVKTYFYDLDQLFANAALDAKRGYTIRAGAYQFRHWQATILNDTTRLVPASRESGKLCRIVFVGDSVTFGHGVNDDQTWVNLVSQDYPNVTFINAGVNGYNASNVLATVQQIEADGYFYTLIDNDASAAPLVPRQPQYPSASALYFGVLFRRPVDVPNLVLFDDALAGLKRENVVIVGFTGDPLAARANVPTVPRWTHRISAFDPHANVQGNREIAEALRPFVDRLVASTC